MTTVPPLIRIYVDADACPVKDEVYRVAERHLARGLDLSVAVAMRSSAVTACV